MNRAAGRDPRLHAPGAFLLAAGGLAFLAKALHSRAGVDELGFVLAPTALLTSVLTGVRFVFEPAFGWVSTDPGYVLAASCSGVNFMVAGFLALAWTLRTSARSWAEVPVLLACVAGSAWLLTVLANTARVALAIPLHRSGLAPCGLAPDELHRLLGVAVYLPALLAGVELAARWTRGPRAPA